MLFKRKDSALKGDANAKSRLISQFHFDSSREALRAYFLANGAALLALLSYLGNVTKAGAKPIFPVPMAVATAAFGTGLLLALIAHLLMWQHQEDVDYERHWCIQNRHIRMILYWSAACLLIGVVGATVATALASGA